MATADDSDDALVNNKRRDIRILILGPTGHGKSSLLKEQFGAPVKVTHGPNPSAHIKPLEYFQVNFKRTTVHLYDTNGFDGRDAQVKAVISDLQGRNEKFDVFLICHKLYGRIDGCMHSSLNLLSKRLGNELLRRSIYVFTFGDEYKIKSEVYKNRRRNPKWEDDLKAEMISQKDSMKMSLNQTLIQAGISREIVDTIPSCIVSGVGCKLPTTENWRTDLWELCIQRCPQDAKSFMTAWRKYRMALLVGAGAGGAAGLTGGVVGGAVIGGAIGSLFFPGIGTGVGAVLGGAIGGVGGVVSGGVLGGAAGSGIKFIKDKLKN